MQFHFFRILKRCLKFKKLFLIKSKNTIGFKKSNILFFETRCRESYLLPFFVGSQCAIYNGKLFTQVNITVEHCIFRLGEFSFTRRLSRDMHQHLVKKIDLKVIKK